VGDLYGHDSIEGQNRGDGLVKEYEESQIHGTAYGTTPVMERTLARNVAHMFNDEEILSYLRN